jgi:hypothetical protein
MLILQKTQDIKYKPSNSRSCKDEMEKVKELELSRSNRIKAVQEEGSDEKHEVAKIKEVN